jgi:hypothetical protein
MDRGDVKPSLSLSEPPKVGEGGPCGWPGEGGTWRDMSTVPLWLCLPLSSASEGRSFMVGGEARRAAGSLFALRFRLSMLLLLDCPFMSGELTLPPTRVLVLMVGLSPMTDPALEVGRDWATPA